MKSDKIKNRIKKSKKHDLINLETFVIIGFMSLLLFITFFMAANGY